jgi:hypothetical protein
LVAGRGAGIWPGLRKRVPLASRICYGVSV